jgi:hypothetical protein
MRSFSVGDRIQFTAPANELKVANRELGAIAKIGPDERLSLKMDAGRAIELDPRKHPHLDHGYAVTSHCSQGQTADRVLIHVDTELGAKDLLNSRMAYFNASCFTTPAIIGADGVGTGFGNSATGLVDGPPQANLDLAVSKRFLSNWPHEKCEIQFRAEFFNALNHPQFANPDANFTSPTFGVISSTSVNARVGQLAVRLAF